MAVGDQQVASASSEIDKTCKPWRNADSMRVALNAGKGLTTDGGFQALPLRQTQDQGERLSICSATDLNAFECVNAIGKVAKSTENPRQIVIFRLVVRRKTMSHACDIFLNVNCQLAYNFSLSFPVSIGETRVFN